MGWLTDLVEEVVDTAVKVVKLPIRPLCAVEGHVWRWSSRKERYVCETCDAEK